MKSMKMIQILLSLSLLVSCTPDLSKIERRQESPPLPQIQTEAAKPSPRVPVPSPKLDTNLKKAIYVRAIKIPKIYALSEILSSWNRTKHTRFVLISKPCPVNSACITVTIKDLPEEKVGEAKYGRNIGENTLRFDPSNSSPYLAQSTACHEFGHFLGLGHLLGTNKTCMTAFAGDNDPIRPTKIDILWADSLGPWNFYRMSVLSHKTVDITELPR